MDAATNVAHDNGSAMRAYSTSPIQLDLDISFIMSDSGNTYWLKSIGPA
ncbi:hypothetical protein PCURB6_18340 [Paenibacillus curdlanolyticus]|nr:hypothetical protein PCURB6_18340 [Paenibacillus curdlanolyticus]